jgi:acyl-homoserine-lactone acylase
VVPPRDFVKAGSGPLNAAAAGRARAARMTARTASVIQKSARRNLMMTHRTTLGSVLLAASLWALLAISPAPAYSNDLGSKATIRRDTYGVPHILAETEESAAFAHGYATAEDHLEELARLFLRARGEQASVLGKDFLTSDRRIHQLGIWETARDRFGEVPPLMRAILNAYAEGYNLYLSGHTPEAPAWARPVTGIDVLAHCRAVLLMDFALDLSAWQSAESRPPSGSNMWAIGRGRSESGRGILLANPHLPWSDPTVFHEVQITVPGIINVSGATLIGFPVVTIGFNDWLGWTHTVNQHDSDDIYELDLNANDPNCYLYDGLCLPLTSKTVTLRVKMAQGVETLTEKLLLSHYGPIIRVQGNKAYAYKSANLNTVNFLTQYNLMAKARTFSEFRAALNMQELPMFNIAYADGLGNVYYLSNSRVPIRAGGYKWNGVIPGNTSRTEWYAMHPIAELPQIFNPPSGYVQNCNDAPWYANLDQHPDSKDFPDYLRSEGLDWRGQISLKMIEAEKSMTLEKVKRLKFNETLMLADRLKPELLALAKSSLENAQVLKPAIAALENWDNRAAVDSTGAVLFMEWWRSYGRETRNRFKTSWNPREPRATPSGLGDPDRALAALVRAAASLQNTFGTVAVPWGNLYRLRRGGLDLPIGGNQMTFRSIWFQAQKDGKQLAVGGDSYVLAVEFTTPPTAFTVLPYSQSARPESKHYADQTRLFCEERMKPSWFTETDIQSHLERAYRPSR